MDEGKRESLLELSAPDHQSVIPRCSCGGFPKGDEPERERQAVDRNAARDRLSSHGVTTPG
jgi:hypothetical protein